MSGGALIVYGANGYSGGLLLDQLKALGVRVIAAGRTQESVSRVVREHDVEGRVFPVDDPRRVDAGLRGAAALLNAAGPFIHTGRPLIDACLRQRVDYLDISGEIDPLAYAAECDRMAKQVGVMLLPGVGFDVVPSDSLVHHLIAKLPGAERLVVSISPSNLLSRGSAATAIAHAGGQNRVRRGGKLETMRFRVQVRWADFGDGMRPTLAASWGDLVTAHHFARIPNVEVYFEATAFRIMAIAGNELYAPILEEPLLRRWLEACASFLPEEGPTRTERELERSVVVAELTRGEETLRARMTTPEAYTFTAESAPRIAREVLSGVRRAGFQSPAALLGPDFVLGIPGVSREALPGRITARSPEPDSRPASPGRPPPDP